MLTSQEPFESQAPSQRRIGYPVFSSCRRFDFPRERNTDRNENQQRSNLQRKSTYHDMNSHVLCCEIFRKRRQCPASGLQE